MNPLTRLLCWFAAFPSAAYAQLETPSNRVWVTVRGFAVILSPLVFTLALQHNGTRVIGTAPYLYLLPVTVYCLDWFLIARSYTATRGAGALVVLRIGVMLVSGFMAIFTGLLSEGENLLQRLHRSEDSVTLRSSSAREINARREEISHQIKRNERVLTERSAIETEALEARRLQQLECKGESGIDRKTGVRILGGKCGRKAEAHRIDAENAEARLAQFDALQTENRKLTERREQLELELGALLKTSRSPGTSMGTLVRALNEADAGLWLSVLLKAFVIVLMEASALLFSELGISPTLRAAVEYSCRLDDLRLSAWLDIKRAEIARERSTWQAAAADGLAPLEVKLTPVTSASPGVRQSEDEIKE